MKHRAGQPGEHRDRVWLPAEQQFQRRYAHAQALRRGLLQNGGQIAAAVKADDGLDGRASVAVVADFALQFRVPVGDTDQSGQMSARRIAGDDHLLGRQLPVRSVSAQEADGGLEVMDLGRESGLG